MNERACRWFLVFLCMVLASTVVAAGAAAQDREILGVTFPAEVTVEGKTLKLNGVAARTAALGFVKVYAGAFYLEHPTADPQEVIESEQVKYFDLHYLTDKATAEKLQEGFVELMRENNPPELAEKHKDDILRHASWMDRDMAPGKTSRTLYLPGQGLRVEYQGDVRGTIDDAEYARMYYRYIFGDKADAKMRDGYLGK